MKVEQEREVPLKYVDVVTSNGCAAFAGRACDFFGSSPALSSSNIIS